MRARPEYRAEPVRGAGDAFEARIAQAVVIIDRDRPVLVLGLHQKLDRLARVLRLGDRAPQRLGAVGPAVDRDDLRTVGDACVERRAVPLHLRDSIAVAEGEADRIGEARALAVAFRVALELAALLRIDEPVSSARDAVELRDCIVRGAVRARALEVDASTIFGTTDAETLAATNSLFLGKVTVVRRQEGCVRFSYLPLDSESPRRFRCQPESAATAAKVRPRFESVTYGEPAFAQLAGATPKARTYFEQLVEVMRQADATRPEPALARDFLSASRR